MGGRTNRRVAACLVAAALFAACTGGDDTTATTVAAASTTSDAGPPPTSTDGGSPTTSEAPVATTTPVEIDQATLADVTAAIDGAPAGCDPLDTRHCLLPFPSNGYRHDGRVAFPAAGMPVNTDGVAIDPTEWNRNTGFSPNTPLLTHVPGLDPVASDLPPWTDIARSLDPDAPIVLVDVATGQRVPLWAELDAKADDDADRLLEIRPAVPLTEGATYAVGLRGLVDTDGAPIAASATFRTFRDALVTDLPEIEQRRPAMELAFDALERGGVDRSELQLAWEFTTATTEDIAGRMLAIRDDALDQLGDATPAFEVTAIRRAPDTDDGIAIQVEGTYTVPNYLTGDGGPGNGFGYGSDGLPVAAGTLESPFVCNISDATLAADEPAHLVQYGHGLLGSHFEIDAGNVRAFANESNVVFCATKWAGMSEDDIGNAAATLAEFSAFHTIADRLQQGVLNQIFLGRVMTGDDGLVTLAEFRRADGTPLIDTEHLDYDGNSQGGIMGLMLAAVSPDIERAVLGVMGMNYSLLLSRSVDFDTYEAIMIPAYPDDLERVLIISIAQMLWDRGEGAGYVQHVTADPYPGTPAKDVLLHVAFGDWQVSELSAFVAARALGATVHRPVTADGRSGEVDPAWGIDTTTYPSDGSGLVVWDSGSDPIPFENLPPRTSRDSHEDPRADPDVRRQKAAFLFDDTLVDVCDAAPCTADQRS